MANKIYTTLRQQLKILRSKNMNISINGQGAKVKKILERENYYSVINGYKDPFIQTSSNNETFISNTQFENLYTLFTFDRNVRLIYLKFILKIEHQIKSVIAHEFSKKYGHDNYLKLGNFDILDNQNCNKKDNNKIKKVLTTIGKLETSLSNQMNKNKEITHYMSTYGYVPLWVLVNILTLGEISYFYSNMKPGDKNNVARVFNVNPEEFSKYIKNLTLSRNLCAHDERFYDFKYRESYLLLIFPIFLYFQYLVKMVIIYMEQMMLFQLLLYFHNYYQKRTSKFLLNQWIKNLKHWIKT